MVGSKNSSKILLIRELIVIRYNTSITMVSVKGLIVVVSSG